jgi:hypothetical protein
VVDLVSSSKKTSSRPIIVILVEVGEKGAFGLWDSLDSAVSQVAGKDSNTSPFVVVAILAEEETEHKEVSAAAKSAGAMPLLVGAGGRRLEASLLDLRTTDNAVDNDSAVILSASAAVLHPKLTLVCVQEVPKIPLRIIAVAPSLIHYPPRNQIYRGLSPITFTQSALSLGTRLTEEYCTVAFRLGALVDNKKKMQMVSSLSRSGQVRVMLSAAGRQEESYKLHLGVIVRVIHGLLIKLPKAKKQRMLRPRLMARKVQQVSDWLVKGYKGHRGLELSPYPPGPLGAMDPPLDKFVELPKDCDWKPKINIVIPFSKPEFYYDRLVVSLDFISRQHRYEGVEITPVLVHVGTNGELEGKLVRLAFKYKASLVEARARHETEFELARSRNIGAVERPNADVFCFIDADVVLDLETISHAVSLMHRGLRAAVVMTSYLPRSVKVAEGDSKEAFREKTKKGGIGPAGFGGCLFIPRDVYFFLRGYDERFVGWGGEDTDMVARLLSVEVPVVNVSAARGIVVAHQWHRSVNRNNDPYTIRNRTMLFRIGSNVRRNTVGWGELR